MWKFLICPWLLSYTGCLVQFFGFPINIEMQPAKIKQYGIFAEEISVFSQSFWSLTFSIPAEAFLSTPFIT